jgi:hypothetical protein
VRQNQYLIGRRPLLLPTSALPWRLGFAGPIYGATAVTCSALLVVLALRLNRSSNNDRRAARRLFVFSISYLFLLSAALLADHVGEPRSSPLSTRGARIGAGSIKAETAPRPIPCSPPLSGQTVSNMRYSLLALALIGIATLGGCVLDPEGRTHRRCRTAICSTRSASCWRS